MKKINVVSLLTGRGGSKLKDKNIIKIDGFPCLYYPCREVKKINSINHHFASSDDDKILKLSNKYGMKKIKRPKKFSRPNSKHIEVLNHALEVLDTKKIKVDILVVLLANAPIIKSKWIDDCIKIINRNKKISAVVPVLKNNDHHPLRAVKKKNGYLTSFFKLKKKISTNRQELESNFFLAHNFWVIRTKFIKNKKNKIAWSFMGNKIVGYEIPFSIDIHSNLDVMIANHLVKNKLY